MTNAEERGLTLVELLLGLALGGQVLLAAWLLVAGITDASARNASVHRGSDSTQLAMRTLAGLVRRVEVGTDSQATFEGGPDAMRFTSWCEAARGWLERCRVTLEITSTGPERAVRLHLNGGVPVALRPVHASAALWYLEDPGNGGRLLSRWGARLTAPQAVLLIVDGDSVVLRLGERG
jgi:hypothetical protein